MCICGIVTHLKVAHSLWDTLNIYTYFMMIFFNTFLKISYKTETTFIIVGLYFHLILHIIVLVGYLTDDIDGFMIFIKQLLFLYLLLK